LLLLLNYLWIKSVVTVSPNQVLLQPCKPENKTFAWILLWTWDARDLLSL
jgi:hypothetical protein